MGLAGFYLRLLGADDGTRTHLCVYVFMDGRHAVAVPCPPQICGHAAISVYSIMAVVDAANLLLNLCFWGIITLSGASGNCSRHWGRSSGAVRASGHRILPDDRQKSISL